MHSIKKSNSGLQIISGKFGISSVAYNKRVQKIYQLEFELERQKETMVKLQLELEQKNEELNSILSKNKKKKYKFNKTIKLIEEVLNICDNKKLDINKEIEVEMIGANNDNEEAKRKTEINFNLYNEKPKEDFNTINSDNNYTNMKTFYKTNNSYNQRKTSLPKIKSHKNKISINTNYNFNFKHKKKIKELQYVSTLKNKISLLNDKLEKKHGEMIKLQNNNTISNFSKLQNDFISNCDKLNEIKTKNINMLSKLIDIEDTYFDEKEQNNKLKIKLGYFVEQFNDYKCNITQKNKTLENKLKTIEDKNIDCMLYHKKESKNKNKSLFDENIVNRSKLIETESILFKKIKEIKEIQKDIDNTIININIYMKEIEKLNKKKCELNDKIAKSKNDIENLNKKKLDLNNKYKEFQEKSQNLKKLLNESENKYKNRVNKINEIKDNINNKNKEIEKLKKEIEEIKNLKIINHFKSNNI